jgi:aspartyl-tRNA(Asn)/glutamyl-tRNA(Gln) amidotransferase subunit A
MQHESLTDYTAVTLAKLIASGELSPVELTKAYLERIDKYDHILHSYITVCKTEAMEAAKRAERSVQQKEPLGPLHGLPLAVKDQYETEGVLTTAGSLNLRHNIPKRDATTVKRAKAAGAILLGKLNMSQFASGYGDPFQFPDPKNPWNLDYDTIGSSNGSAIAIAASLCTLSFGEDTGGSIRCPSSACGVVGLRPTWGRVSRYGVMPLSWSMDTGGPITRTVEDSAILLEVMAGYDPSDPQTSKLPVPTYKESLSNGISGMRIGLIQEFLDPEFVDQEIINAVRSAAKVLSGQGATLEDVSLPILQKVGLAAGPVTSNDAGHVHLERLRKNPGIYSPRLLTKLLAGALIPSQTLQQANRIRTVMRHQWLELFKNFDVLISPTILYKMNKATYEKPAIPSAGVLSKFGKGSGDSTIVAAFLGTPALTVPCGFDSNGLPIGLHIMSSHFKEEEILRVGFQYEQATDWHTKRPLLKE